MDETENINQFAYFREFTHTQQFELCFILDTEITHFGVFKEEIKAVRAMADTVSSLLQHIQNKIQKILQDKYMNDNEKGVLDENFEIPVSLKTNRKHVKGTMGLVAFRNSLFKDTYIVFKVFDQQYFILPNAPLIKQIKLPAVLYTDTCVQPAKFSALFTDNQRSIFIWYKSQDKVNWKEAGKGYGYLTKNTDVGFYLKLICKPISNSDIWGPPGEAISDTVVENMGDLPTCPFEQRHEYTKEKLADKNE